MLMQPQNPIHRIRSLLWCGLMMLVLGSGPGHAAEATAAWSVAMAPDPLTRQTRCLLSSAPQVTSDGYDSTPVTLVFNGTQLLVVTQSELDASFADLQLVVDEQAPLRANQIVGHQMVLAFEINSLPDLVQQLREGHQLTVSLRFWPKWPVTRAFPVVFSLRGFSKAHDAFSQGC